MIHVDYRLIGEAAPVTAHHARLSTLSAANMNGWRKVGNRKEATNDRMWVLATAKSSTGIDQLKTLRDWWWNDRAYLNPPSRCVDQSSDLIEQVKEV